MHLFRLLGFPGGTGVRNPHASAGDTRDAGSIPGSERAPGVGIGNPLQYSCLENSMENSGYSRWGHKESDTNEHSAHTLRLLNHPL